MRKKFIIFLLFILVIYILAGCDASTFNREANIEIDGEIETGVKDYGSPYYSGRIKNNGNLTAYNIKVAFTIYQTEKKKT